MCRFAPVSPSGACLESDDGLVCLCCSLLRCVANGLCKPGDLLIRPHYTAGALSPSERGPRRMNPRTELAAGLWKHLATMPHSVLLSQLIMSQYRGDTLCELGAFSFLSHGN